jgi:ubiquinone/menaquinone biosynthesis C-methylase UbiE
MMDYPATSIFDSIAEAYDGWYDTSEGHSIFQEEVQCLRQLGDDYSGRWLEVGVGTGRFAAALGITHGVDPSPQMAVMAKRRGVTVPIGRVEQLPFQDRVFDGVLMALTLCFVVNPEQAFRECARILRGKGRLVIGTIPADNPWGRFYFKKKAAGHPIYSHAHFRTATETIHFAEKKYFKLRTSCSALFGEPDRYHPERSRIESGIIAGAGFVGLLFEVDRSGV